MYAYAGDGKRYVFPNEQTYKSWYKDFSGVKTITDSELAAIMIGGNVTTRPGTSLVKITTDPKVYAVSTGGKLHWVESEAIAKALYGNDWAKRVVDVSDAFFVNYSISSSISSNVHPDGTLVQYAGDSAHYVVVGGMKRKLSDAAFAANGYNHAFSIMTTIAYGTGSDVAGRESSLADVAAPGSSSTGSTGALTVSLASDSPMGSTVPKNASSVPLVKVNLTAGGANVVVSGLRFHRVGTGAVGDFSNVYLYDGSGKRLSTGRSINSTSHLVEFNSVNLSVLAGQTMSVFIYGDFSGSSATVGGEHRIQVDDASAVTVSGSATVSGSFPVMGQTFKVGSTSSARVDILKGSTPSNPNIGAKGAEVSNFKIVANTNDVEVTQVTLYQAGDITNADLTNLQLFQGSTLVAEAAGVANDGRAFLKFKTPFVIPSGNTRVFSLKADVGGRAGRTIRTYVEYTTDVSATDKVYSAGAQIDIATKGSFDGSSYTSCTSAGNSICVTTQGGSLTNSFNGPATTNVARGKLGVELYKFTLTSADNNLEIRNVRMALAVASSSATGGVCAIRGSSNTVYFRSLKIKNLDNGQTLTSRDLSSTGSSSTQALTFADTFNINAGQTLNLALVADLANSEDSSGEFYANGNCLYRASFKPFELGDVKVVSTGESLALAKIVPNDTVNGNNLTVKSSSLDITLASNPVSGTVVKKQQNLPIAAVNLSAGAQSDVTVTSMTFTGQADVVGDGLGSSTDKDDFDSRVTSLKLMDGATQVGLAKAPDSTGGTVQISNMNFTVPKGTTKTLSVVASLSSSSSSTSPYDRIAVGISAASDVVVQDSDSNSVTPTVSTVLTTTQLGASPSVKQTIIANGTLSVQADSHPVAGIVVAGKDAWVPFAQYKATAQYEDITIDRIAVAANPAGGSADSADFAMVAIAAGGAVKAQDSFASGSTSTKDLDLSANKIVVPKDGSTQFQVWVKVAAVSASSSVSGATTGVARAGHVPTVGINSSLVTGEWDSNYASKLNIRATGAASGEKVYAATGASNGNVMQLRKTQPIVTKQSLSSATLANVDQDLIRFQVSADSAGSVAWKQATFSISKSSAVALSNFRLRRGSSDISTSIIAITNATSGADLLTTSVPAAVNSVTVVVSFQPGQEEAISGSGNVYTLHATVSGAASGQNVTTQFYRDPNSTAVTGYLASTFAFGGWASSANVFHVDSTASPSSSPLVNVATGTFVWADNSEVPHSSAVGTSSGSRDWTNDLYVQDLSQAQTVSL